MSYEHEIKLCETYNRSREIWRFQMAFLVAEKFCQVSIWKTYIYVYSIEIVEIV